MEILFLKLWNISITASYLVFAILVLRLLLKKAPKKIAVIMWAFVGIRLLCPVSFESILSLIPSAQTIPETILYADTPTIQSGIPILNTTLNPAISNSLAPSDGDSVNPVQNLVFFASIVWIMGMFAMLLYTMISYLRIHRKVREAIPLYENIWLCDHISTPFLLGMIQPRVYLPSAIQEEDIKYVVAHEKAHKKRHDHWWKPLGFLLLAVYWFQPALWLAYLLFCRDLELACDEKVIQDFGTESKKKYAVALLNCSMPRKSIAACPLAFGEVGVKARIKAVLQYKKPALWVLLISIFACIALAVGFLTSPANDEVDMDTVKDGDQEREKSLSVLENSSNVEGISITIKRVELNSNQPYIELEWRNETDEEYIYGEAFDILFNENGEFISCARKDLIFHTIGIILQPQNTDTKIYSVSDFDLSKTGEYRFVVGFKHEQWIDFEIQKGAVTTVDATLEEKGVTYSYYYKSEYDIAYLSLMPETKQFSLTLSMLSSYLPQGTYEEVGDVITLTDSGKNTYTFKKEGNHLIFLEKLSSKLPKYRYVAESDEPQVCIPDQAIFEFQEAYKMYYDKISADLDGDGVVEEWVLGYGPTSGIFTFTISGWKEGELKYFNIFTSDFYYMNFVKNADGHMQICGEAQEEEQKTEYFDIQIEDGNIVLFTEEEQVAYWGEQGIHSSFAPN